MPIAPATGVLDWTKSLFAMMPGVGHATPVAVAARALAKVAAVDVPADLAKTLRSAAPSIGVTVVVHAVERPENQPR